MSYIRVDMLILQEVLGIFVEIEYIQVLMCANLSVLCSDSQLYAQIKLWMGDMQQHML